MQVDFYKRLTALLDELQRELNQEVIDYNKVALFAEFALNRAYEILLLNGGEFELQHAERVIQYTLQVTPDISSFLHQGRSLLNDMAKASNQQQIASICALLVEQLLYIKTIANSRMNLSEYLLD
ncbi:hypothetical protein [Shewanella waksmanii]|uniref:hypothetical protein n=1 Tax=Shewanella waksmanii TaxID=213783 RepID=UPI003735071B